jgi:hypothetical protein
VFIRRWPADYSTMTNRPSQISDRFSAEWLAGYRMALADLDRLLAGIGGAATEGVVPHLRARLAAHLVTPEARRPAA